MASDAVERAFGPPGQDGDPDRIMHLAKRMNSVYEGFMDWAARVRSVSAPSEFHHVLELLAQLVDGPVHTYREFVDELVAQADQIPAAVAKGETPREVQMTFVLEIPDEATEAFSAELERVMSA